MFSHVDRPPSHYAEWGERIFLRDGGGGLPGTLGDVVISPNGIDKKKECRKQALTMIIF